MNTDDLTERARAALIAVGPEERELLVQMSASPESTHPVMQRRVNRLRGLVTTHGRCRIGVQWMMKCKLASPLGIEAARLLTEKGQ